MQDRPINLLPLRSEELEVHATFVNEEKVRYQLIHSVLNLITQYDHRYSSSM